MKPKQKLIAQTILVLCTVIVTTVLTWIIDIERYYPYWFLSMIFGAIYLSSFAIRQLRLARNLSLASTDKMIRDLRLTWMWITIGIIVLSYEFWFPNWTDESAVMHVMTVILYHIKSFFSVSSWYEFVLEDYIYILTIILLFLSLRLESNKDIVKVE